MTLVEIMMWKESLASCAIEGNEDAERILVLEKTDPDVFYLELFCMNESRKRSNEQR